MISTIKKIFLYLSIFLILAASCKPQKEPLLIKIGGGTQGTYYAITYYSIDSFNLQPAIDSLLRRFDSTASTYKPNSIISRMNANDSLVSAH